MTVATMIVWALAMLFLAVACIRRRGAHRAVLAFAWRQALPIVGLLVAALAAAGFLSALLPDRLIAAIIGPESGLTGILVATLTGYLISAGSVMTFPILAALLHAGAGQPQLVAMITSWLIFSVYRVYVWEVPMLGHQFAWRRVTVSLAFPVGAALAVGLAV